MNKLIYLFSLSLFVFASCDNNSEIIDLDSVEKKSPKVDVCHYDAETDTWKTINISENALKAHLKHGDFEGACEDIRTYVPDDNFETWLICSGYDDIMDDYVLTSNINTVEDIHFYEAGAWSPCEEFGSVTDLTGIEAFTALKHLQIDEGHSIEIIDLTKNTSLISILMHQTFRGFDNLDLTKNIALEWVSFSSVPIGGALDLSNCPNLSGLTIEDTLLDNLNLKNGNNTGITSPILDNNDNLTCIQVDDAVWSTNNWTSVDVWMSFSEDCSVSP